MPEPAPLRFSGCHVVTGGTGGLGLLFASWLAEHGAEHLALMSRSGRIQDDSLQKLWDKAAKLSNVQVLTGDIGNEQEVADILKKANETMPSLTGIWHAAGVLDDHLMADLTSEHFERVLLPKIKGTLNLHFASSLFNANIEHFVLFSSVASMIGTAGQGNYCAANAFMDSFACHRVGVGLKGVSVQWGPWAEVGMAARALRTPSVTALMLWFQGRNASFVVPGVYTATRSKSPSSYVRDVSSSWASLEGVLDCNQRRICSCT